MRLFREQTRAYGALVMAVALAVLPTSASAAVRYFSFTIPGFSNGGAINGTFAGEDLDGDGSLVQFPSIGLTELTAFTATFSGNSVTPAYTWTLNAFEGDGTRLFAYHFDGSFGGLNNGLGEGFALFPASPPNRILSGGSASDPNSPGFFYSDGVTGSFEMTSSPGIVTELAAPGAPAPLLGLGLLPALAGFGGLAATRRRRRATQSPASA